MDIPQVSPLAKLIAAQTPSNLPPSQKKEHYALACQVLYNLRYEHQWTSLQIHTHSPLSPDEPLPRPLISGLPPRRLYVHPDEQVELVREHTKRRQKCGDIVDAAEEELPKPEREWVLPTYLLEKWSLKRFAEIFDGISVLPPEPPLSNREGEQSGEMGASKFAVLEGDVVRLQTESENKWRTVKRILLATTHPDSTIVYYIVHDGLVKPRPN